MRKKEKVICTILLSIIGLLFLWPLLWMVDASFDAAADLTINLPHAISLDNFRIILSDKSNTRAFSISFFIAFTDACMVVILSILAAYPLSRYHLKYKNTILYSMLFLTGLPITAIMVPVYILFYKMHLSNSVLATTFFLIASGLPYSIWMMKNFMDDVPVVLEEAAWIEGAGSFTTIRKVILPIILPGLFVVFIFTFSGAWGNFFVPFILLNSTNKMPAAVKIYQFFGNHGSVNYGPVAAFSLLYTLPIAILYFVSQKFMSNGFSFGGAVKQ